MTMQDFVSAGWKDHGDDAEAVFERFGQGLELVESSADALSLSALVVHVAGEHLGRWDEGLELLKSLEAHESCADDDTRAALLRSRAVLHHCAGQTAERDACLTDGRDPARPAASSQVRVWAIATSALAGQGRSQEAIETYRRALELAEYGPGADDPAARALAVTSNNLACELEERPERSLAEDELLREAAVSARRFWEIAGTWTNVERAEYRLAMTHLALGEPEAALGHARRCFEICEENGADAVELFFAHEAIAKAQHAGGRVAEARRAREEAAHQLEAIEQEGMRPYCAGELEKLDALLGGSEGA